MRRKVLTLAGLFGLAIVRLTAAPTNLPKTGLAGTTHDIGANGCKSCHAPHNGALANGGNQNTGLILLWSRSFPAASATYGVYSSNTTLLPGTELGGSLLTTSTDVRMYSLLCLSCHDGVTSTFTPAMQNKNMVGASPTRNGATYESLGLTNDHPVNMNYDPTKNTSLAAVATVSAALPLYGASNSVQCATCHDPHNNVNTNYLRQANNTSHCTTCHM